MTISLRPYQEKGVAEIRAAFAGKDLPDITHRAGHHGPARSCLFVLPTGGGKCLGRGTPVMKYDGTVVPVESIEVGDLLMGPDSKPRKVVNLARGSEMLYRVKPVKGDPYVVNESHILSLRSIRLGTIRNISVKDYLAEPFHWRIRQSGWRVPNILSGDNRYELSQIDVEQIGVGDYYGFELSGPDRLFLLGDFTVTHNTFTFAYITEQASAKGNRVLIVAHRKELIRQASLSLAALGVVHQVVAPDDKIAAIRRAHIDKYGRPFLRTGAEVAVGSVQTIPRRKGWLNNFNPALLVVDEAHHSVAGQWRNIIEALPNTKILGVTATPCRTDGQGLGDIYETMVLGPTMRELIEMGNLCPPRIFCPPLGADLSKVRMSGGDYNSTDLAAELDKPKITGDAVSHYRKLSPSRPAIVFCSSVIHAQHVAAQFCADGWQFVVVTGDMDDTERDSAISGLADGRIHGIVTVDVVSEGTDIPVAEVAILLRPTQSEGLYLQQVGRVLRPAPGKEFGLILDHVGNVKEHGLPHSDREWSLDAEKRSKRKSESGPRVLICPSCYLPHEPQPNCPGCGYKYEAKVLKPLTQSDDELMEINQEEAELLRMQQRWAQAQARDLASLKAAGMSTLRAQHILAARAEKDRLRTELMNLARDHAKKFGAGVLGYTAADIKGMKPKQLREEIERVSGRLFGLVV